MLNRYLKGTLSTLSCSIEDKEDFARRHQALVGVAYRIEQALSLESSLGNDSYSVVNGVCSEPSARML